MESINDLIKLFEEIASDIDRKDYDFVKIHFEKEEIKRLLNCLKELEK